MIKKNILEEIKTKREKYFEDPSFDVRIVGYYTNEECDYDKITFLLEQDNNCREKWLKPTTTGDLCLAEYLVKYVKGASCTDQEARDIYKEFYANNSEKTIKKQFPVLSALQYDNDKEVFISALDGDLITEK